MKETKKSDKKKKLICKDEENDPNDGNVRKDAPDEMNKREKCGNSQILCDNICKNIDINKLFKKLLLTKKLSQFIHKPISLSTIKNVLILLIILFICIAYLRNKKII